MVSGGESSEDWYIDGSDDEKYNPGQGQDKGVWHPRPENILDLFEKLEKNKVLELTWKCPGRRPPDREEEEEVDTCPDTSMEVETDVKIELK